jgi:hypothetical protein
MGRHKRPRGAPLGNQNARKHGFYVENLSSQEELKFWNTVNVQGVSPRMLALRMKLACAVKNAPGNTRVLMEASRLLSKFTLTQQDLNRKGYTETKKIIRGFLQAVAAGDEKLTEQIVSELLGRAE